MTLMPGCILESSGGAFEKITMPGSTPQRGLYNWLMVQPGHWHFQTYSKHFQCTATTENQHVNSSE